MRPLLVAALAGALALLACELAACGLEVRGGGAPDATTGDAQPDIAPDVPLEASGDVGPDIPTTNCAVAACNGECVLSCDGCDAGLVLCGATRVCGDCSSCPTGKIQCFTCPAGQPVGTCQPKA